MRHCLIPPDLFNLLSNFAANVNARDAVMLEICRRLCHLACMQDPDAKPDAGALPRSTRRSLPMALLTAREAVMSHFRPMLDGYDVNEQQWRVIRVLAESGQMSASDVAEKANILAPSLTRMIRSMTERGLILKASDDSDGRRVMLEIAPAGRELLRRVAPDSSKIYAELEAKFGKERFEQLVDLLEEFSKLKA
jgi:homoprotocatechuate degradation regulator HpaR